jgi:transposase InsO family protein
MNGPISGGQVNSSMSSLPPPTPARREGPAQLTTMKSSRSDSVRYSTPPRHPGKRSVAAWTGSGHVTLIRVRRLMRALEKGHLMRDALDLRRAHQPIHAFAAHAGDVGDHSRSGGVNARLTRSRQTARPVGSRGSALTVGGADHPTGDRRVRRGRVDAFSRLVVGWSIARPPARRARCRRGCSAQRLRTAGVLASMGTVGDALDNAVAESFFASCRPSYWTDANGTTAGSWPGPSSTTSSASTTPSAATPPSASKAATTMKPRAGWRRHDPLHENAPEQRGTARPAVGKLLRLRPADAEWLVQVMRACVALRRASPSVHVRRAPRPAPGCPFTRAASTR